MPGLGDTIAALGRMKQHSRSAMANLAEPLRLTLVAPTGQNPGQLRMLTYVPPGLPAGAPLVVVLHGCTQNAPAYDYGSGWSTLAERHGFAVLFPEQQRGNNPSLCFNWFQPDDVTRGHGEVESIREMVLQTVATHALDARRVFITGLSAGGAMTAAMLATAPELFAGGAIIAGLAYGAASSMTEAFHAMGHPVRRTGRAWGDLVRGASEYRGARPPVQIWTGTEDATVVPGHADELVLQWADVLGLPPAPTLQEDVAGAHHQVWQDDQRRSVLERWTVPSLGHGTPITPDAADFDQSAGVAAPHMLASTVSSTYQLARSWGLLTQAAAPRRAASNTAVKLPIQAATSIINGALRAAGLMK